MEEREVIAGISGGMHRVTSSGITGGITGWTSEKLYE